MEFITRTILNKITVAKKAAAIILPVFLLASIPTQRFGVDAVSDQLNVVFEPGSADLGQIASEYGLKDVKPVFTSKELPATYKAVIDSSKFAEMNKDRRIKYAQLDRTIQAAAITTNDPYFTTDSTLTDKQWFLGKIDVSDAWTYTTGSASVVIAVVDTGIHGSHIELNDGRIAAGYNTINGQEILAGQNSDDNGHGTAVAGVIGAIPNNGKGVSGINWSVKIMPIKSLEANGSGLVSSVASGIVWASDHGASIINLSLGGGGFPSDQTLNNAISYAFNKGALIVAAAGNDLADNGLNLDQAPVYPVCADLGSNMVLGVAASDNLDRKANFSNFGINCVDIIAPGKRILTTTFLPSEPSNNLLIYGSGTSLAAPVVSGVAALIKANNPSYTNIQIRDAIFKTADNIDALNQNNCLDSSCNGFLGKGRINASNALSPVPIGEGSLLRELLTGFVYQISAGAKRLVTDYVFNQRGLSAASVISDSNNVLSSTPAGAPLPPSEGTLIKGDNNPTVYVIDQGLKRPLTYLVFVSRNYSFANVTVQPQSFVDSLLPGDWYWPPDGTMVLVKGNPTVYVMDQSVRRPVTYFVFTQRNLSFAKVVSVTSDEFSHVPAAKDQYWLPPVDGTLVKSANDPTVYVMESGAKRGVSYEMFVSRAYKFSNIKTLPKAEMDVIAPGTPLL